MAKSIPRHIAIIMDGNGRWAEQRRLPRTLGHRKGVERVKEIVRAAREMGVEALTLYAFSTENWGRPKREVGTLMRYLEVFLKKEIKLMNENGVRLLVIGDTSAFPRGVQQSISKAKSDTAHNTKMKLVLALNYGARQEIIRAVRGVAEDCLSGRRKKEDITEKSFGEYLYTAGIPDPDLMIRTSGEVRLSNFLLWQLSYAEFYFTRKMWPDFGKEDLDEALEHYSSRRRRFGGLDAG